MPEKITDTALLECTQGTITSKLKVSSQNFCLIEGKPITTEKDKEPGVNIKRFGNCRLKPTPGGFLRCIPNPGNWKDTSARDEINGNKILLATSVCPCATGGTIKVRDKGHSINQQAG